MAEKKDDLKKLYSTRFEGETVLIKKNKVWETLCKSFLQAYIPTDSRVLDVAAGYCEFINNINALEKYAVDLNPDIFEFTNESVIAVNENILDEKSTLPTNYFDIVFISNFLEHLDSKDDVLSVVKKAKTLLNDSGKIIILQPNIRYVGDKYWDYFDHKTPLTEKSLIELANILDLSVVHCLKRTIPYTQKSALPVNPLLIKIYCKMMPLSSLFFGAQCLLILQKK